MIKLAGCANYILSEREEFLQRQLLEEEGSNLNVSINCIKHFSFP